MFAFGLWDRNRRKVFLARDRFGKKPLYYSKLDTDELIFGSELKVLLAHPVKNRRFRCSLPHDISRSKTVFEKARRPGVTTHDHPVGKRYFGGLDIHLRQTATTELVVR